MSDEHLTVCVCGHVYENHRDGGGACTSPECSDGGCDRFRAHFWEEIEEEGKSKARMSMIGQEPTERQLNYLRNLGHTNKVSDRYDAFLLIQELTEKEQ